MKLKVDKVPALHFTHEPNRLSCQDMTFATMAFQTFN